MLFRRKRKARLLAPAAGFDIVVFVLAEGNIGQRPVRDGGKLFFQRRNRLALLVLDRPHLRFQIGDLGLQLFRQSLILGLHRRADFLRGGVAPLLRALSALNRGAARVVQFDQTRDQSVGGGFVLVAAQEVGAKRVRIVADRFDVVHDGNPLCVASSPE